MTKAETKKLFILLEQFYPNYRPKNISAFQGAWILALEPYEYEDVKVAAISYSAQNKYFPDLADLTAGLKRRGEEKTEDGKGLKDDSALLRQMLDRAKQGDA